MSAGAAPRPAPVLDEVRARSVEELEARTHELLGPWLGTGGKMRKPTIYEALEAKLGRAPTNAELTADVRRILREATAELASRGKLRFQRKA